jgi:ubiquinone/menaquinone biosynthesis C-methylase UbiE
MAHKFNAKNKSKLDNEWRRKVFEPFEVIKKLKIKNDDILADIGCGIGYLTIPAAKTLNNGYIYAMDTSDEMLEDVEKKIKEEDISNIRLVKTDEYDLKVDKNLITYGYMVNVLHEIEDKSKFLSNVKDILKVDGKIAIIEWEKEKMESGPPLNHRLSKGEVKKYLENTGFEVNVELDFSGFFYGIIAKK